MIQTISLGILLLPKEKKNKATFIMYYYPDIMGFVGAKSAEL